MNSYVVVQLPVLLLRGWWRTYKVSSIRRHGDHARSLIPFAVRKALTSLLLGSLCFLFLASFAGTVGKGKAANGHFP